MIDEKKKSSWPGWPDMLRRWDIPIMFSIGEAGFFFFKILVPTYRGKAQHKTASP